MVPHLEKHHASCRVDNGSGWESGAVPSLGILKSKKTDLVFRKFQGEGGAWLGGVLKELGRDQAFYCLPPLIFPRRRPTTFQRFRFRHSLVSCGMGDLTYFRTSDSFLRLKNKGGWRDGIFQG